MNPSDLNMIWMGHYAPDRSVLFDESSTIYNQPMAGMSVIDDLTQQTHAMVNIYIFFKNKLFPLKKSHLYTLQHCMFPFNLIYLCFIV